MSHSAQVDIIQQNGGSFNASGPLAQMLLNSKFDVNAMRTNDVLRKDEWEQFDQKVVEVARTRLVGVADLMERGLSFNIDNPLGITRLEYEKVSDMNPASVDMSGVTEGQNDRLTFDLEGLPLPIVHKDFNINIRALAASRNIGQSLDTMQAALASRLVSEKIESLLFLGDSSIKMQGSTILGYTTATNRNTGSITARWDTATGEQILGDVLDMISALVADNMYGPYGLYIPTDYGVALNGDFKANSDKSIRSRLEEISEIDFIKSSSNLPGGASGQIVMVQLTSDVVDMIDGLQPTTVMWETKGGMIVNFKVMAIMTPRVRTGDSTGQHGVAHFSV